MRVTVPYILDKGRRLRRDVFGDHSILQYSYCFRRPLLLVVDSGPSCCFYRHPVHPSVAMYNCRILVKTEAC